MYHIAGFYKFKKLSNIKKNKKILQTFFLKNSIRGTLILAPEGINATLSTKKKNLYLVLNKVKKFLKLIILIVKIYLNVNFNPFIEVRLKLRKK